jgi:ubiquinone/menaquinone biosynthesis C-methylase UbiE
MRDMDYDKSTIPAVYDRARDLAPDVVQLWLDLVARDAGPAPGSLILDAGCGTGRFCEPLAERFAGRVLGVDPSEQMLEVARKKATSGRVEFRRANADQLPLGPGTADMVFLSMVFHNLQDADAAAREFRRVLQSGGQVCVRTVTRDGDVPHRRFFPSVGDVLPTRAHVDAVFADAGFSKVAQEIVTQVVAATWPDFVGKVALRAYSTVASLSDAEFEAGMAALRSHVPPGGPDCEVTEEVDWFVFEAP